MFLSTTKGRDPEGPGPSCDLRVGLQVAQEATRVLAPLPVELPLFLLSLGLCLARLLPLLGLLRCLGLALLGAALSLLGLLTGYSACSFLHLALGFLRHPCPPVGCL